MYLFIDHKDFFNELEVPVLITLLLSLMDSDPYFSEELDPEVQI